MNSAIMRAAIIAGEPSGDLLAARLIKGLRANTEVQAMGIGGPAMLEAGFDLWHPMDALSVFGYVDALKRAPKLIRTWLDTKNKIVKSKPDVLIGVDAPDFNLKLELKARKSGIPTVHFVGPSIWAWRYERINLIRAAVSHMLVLFPFEVEIYEREQIPVTYVGHPLAELIPKEPDSNLARKNLSITNTNKILAVLPGSRESEIKLLAPRFLQAVQILQDQDPDLQVLVPVVNQERRAQLESILVQYPVKNCQILSTKPDLALNDDRHGWPIAWHVMEAADAVLLASGTATLETALFKKPMVISYVLSPLMRKLMAWKSGQQAPSLPWVGLPNILERDFVVPELLQDDATPKALAEHTWQALTDIEKRTSINYRFTELHNVLNQDTPGISARAILDLCK